MPVGQDIWGLQIGYFASYTALFAGGCAMAGSRWLENIGPEQANRWRLAAWIVGPLLFVYGIVLSLVQGKPFDTEGGWTLPALAYAFWEPFVAWGIILGMLVLKFALAGVTGVAASFLAARLALRLPEAKSIL